MSRAAVMVPLGNLGKACSQAWQAMKQVITRKLCLKAREPAQIPAFCWIQLQNGENLYKITGLIAGPIQPTARTDRGRRMSQPLSLLSSYLSRMDPSLGSLL